jgi:hypothetical protein
MYSLLINLLSRQSIPLIFRICINLVQFARSNAFCQTGIYKVLLYVVAYIYADTLEAAEPRVHGLAIGLGEGPAINSVRLQRLLKRTGD